MKKYFIPLIIATLVIICSGCNINLFQKNKIKSMTIKEKVTQMILPSFRYETYSKNEKSGEIKYTNLEYMNDELKAFLEEYKFAGVILFSENFQSSKQAYQLIKDLKEANAVNNDIPLLIGVDQEGGYVRRVNFGTMMPGNMALCATGDPQNAYASASIIGSELDMLGINLNFAPVVDVNSNPNNPVIGVRSFSDDVMLMKDFIAKSIQGYQDQNIATSIKHFPGHGDTAVDSHTGLPTVNKSLEEIKTKELKAFEYGIDAHTDMIMTAHIQFPNIDETPYLSKDGKEIVLPATLSKKMLNLLRKDYQYDGVIITDALNMDAIEKYYKKEDVAELAINAGVDILLIPVSFEQDLSSYIQELEEYIDMVVRLVETGRIQEETIDQAVQRILKLKKKRNLSDKVKEEVNYQAKIGSKEHHDLEMEITKKAITLVENDDVLPLSSKEKTLFLYPFTTQEKAIQFGEQMLLERGLIEKETIEQYCYGDDDLSTFEAFINQNIKSYDNVVAISAMYSNEDINGDYANFIDYAFQKAKEFNRKTVLMSAQLPYDLDRFEADSKIALYFGSGVYEIPTNYDEDVLSYAPNIPASILLLYGDGEFVGKLPVNIPEVIYDEKNNQYSFGDSIRYPRGE